MGGGCYGQGGRCYGHGGGCYGQGGGCYGQGGGCYGQGGGCHGQGGGCHGQGAARVAGASAGDLLPQAADELCGGDRVGEAGPVPPARLQPKHHARVEPARLQRLKEYILTADQSDAGSADIFSQRTNRTSKKAARGSVSARAQPPRSSPGFGFSWL
eukprot:1190599-Prorocentrum_minimum.AAC.3